MSSLRRNFCLGLLGMSLTSGVMRSQDATSPIAGKWHFVFDTESDVREFDALFTVDDGKVGGTFGKSEVAGTAKGNDFDLQFETVSEEVGKGTLKLTGKENAGQLSGKWSFQTYDGTFKATRPKSATGN